MDPKPRKYLSKSEDRISAVKSLAVVRHTRICLSPLPWLPENGSGHRQHSLAAVSIMLLGIPWPAAWQASGSGRRLLSLAKARARGPGRHTRRSATAGRKASARIRASCKAFLPPSIAIGALRVFDASSLIFCKASCITLTAAS